MSGGGIRGFTCYYYFSRVLNLTQETRDLSDKKIGNSFPSPLALRRNAKLIFKRKVYGKSGGGGGKERTTLIETSIKAR